jgi:hypothetical protein
LVRSILIWSSNFPIVGWLILVLGIRLSSLMEKKMNKKNRIVFLFADF